ncbi:Undecaprenyl phosphate-alpha-4-amino-4-deoxy-L-arabinose arabinosyl transferase [Pseudobythopirellula maris]|uniref:Undecaprenyl phosphate-alpha-4-amino-4-deoxy-L-arabinose arabinosyl transferase n=1 Tax=Pseudobythopirellula maris TaxID=2527991 RepID=A0A5C5ZUU8_9BACT|nr:glycosyltransferase family 39 protein [Pseudobythopirellula maris]TWT90875.1 Undecaprenyl phosphate-alpha-4-amino-4-deoxy-L-arabinose arabinosyl transferase [Pseudobythopirellula maris]
MPELNSVTKLALSPKLAPWAAVTIAAVVFLTQLGAARLWDDDEPRNARCAVEMFERGDLITPTFNGELRAHKPALLYWLMMASYAMFGVSEFSARLPSALCGIGAALLCYHLGRLLFDRTIGLLAAALLSSALMFAVASRAATPDALLITCVTAALYLFAKGVARLRGGDLNDTSRGSLSDQKMPLGVAAAMYVAMGLAVLAKGPVGLVLPGAVIALFAVLLDPDPAVLGSAATTWYKRLAERLGASLDPRRVLRLLGAVRFPLGLVIVALVALPWYVAVGLATGGDFLSGFLGTHNVGRFMEPMEGHDGAPLFYVIAIMAGFFPASCFLPVATVSAVRSQLRPATKSASYGFLIAWVAAYLVVFTIAATKLPSYVTPCYAALAVGTAAWLVEQVRSKQAAGVSLRSWLAAGVGSFLVVGVGIGVALGVVAIALLEGDSALGWRLGAVALIPAAGGAYALAAIASSRPTRAVVGFAAAGVVFTTAAMAWVAPQASPFADGPRIAERIRQLEAADPNAEPFDVLSTRYTRPTTVYYLGRTIERNDDPQRIRDRLTTPGSLVVASAEAYENLKATLPPGVVVLAEEHRLMRPEKGVVLLGQAELQARLPAEKRLTR